MAGGEGPGLTAAFGTPSLALLERGTGGEAALSPSRARAIQVLPPAVAERIAAGEVVERPASVVRELVDNAIDAGARAIRIEIRGGGLDLIQVSDDGCGIPSSEVEIAFRRHATSKLRTAEDLARVTTLGFRGEALPSIAAVAEVELLTRTPEEEIGTAIVRRGETVVERGRRARAPGTTVTVRRLFQGVPARLKLAENRRAETAQIGQIVRRYALARPDLRFSFVLDGRLAFQSSGRGRLDLALAEVYGEEVAAHLLALPADPIGRATLSGVLTGRAFTRPGRQHLHLIVNDRWAHVRGLAEAAETAYRGVLPRGRHPVGVIGLSVPPDELDVNVHPAKTEIRLIHEAAVAERLAEAIRQIYGRAPDRPPQDLDFALGPVQAPLPAVGGGQWAVGRREGLLLPGRRVAEPRPGWREPQPFRVEDLRVIGQIRETLLVAEGPGGLFLVDQHRAHERIIYERLRAQVAARGGASGQALLEPLVVEVPAHLVARLAERIEELSEIGFVVERFGGHSFLVRAVPAAGGREDLVPGLAALLEEAATEEDHWRDRLLIAVACRSAIRRGRGLPPGEQEELLRQLAGTTAPAVCPHGSPIILAFDDQFLERQFRWR